MKYKRAGFVARWAFILPCAPCLALPWVARRPFLLACVPFLLARKPGFGALALAPLVPSPLASAPFLWSMVAWLAWLVLVVWVVLAVWLVVVWSLVVWVAAWVALVFSCLARGSFLLAREFPPPPVIYEVS